MASGPSNNRSILIFGAMMLAGGAIILGTAFFALAGDSEPTNPATTTATSQPSEDGQQPEQTATSEPGETAADDEADQLIERVDPAPTILVRGPTPLGWTIESPDQFGFYPVGPAGPATFTATESTGFTQTPEGAGLAAIHIIQRINPAANPEWATTIDTQVVGAGKDAAAAGLAIIAADEGQLAELRAATATKTAWVGWNVRSFDPQLAELQLAGFGTLDDQVLRFTLDVRLEWLDGDWRLVTQSAEGGDLTNFVGVVALPELDVDMREAFAV